MRARRRAVGLLLFVASFAGCAEDTRSAAAPPLQCGLDLPPAALPSELAEASGAAGSRRNPAFVWVHNDSGGGAELFGVLHDGSPVARVRVVGAVNEDWEDIAAAPCPDGTPCLFLGDIGDNGGDRRNVTIYRIPEPQPGDTESAAAEVLTLRYPDGPRDAEALFILPGGALYVVSKGGNSEIALYRISPPLPFGRAAVLEYVRSLSDGPVPLEDRVTAADASATGDWVALRTRSALLLYSTDDLLSGGSPPINAPLGMLREPQGEGVAFIDDGRIILTSEGGQGPLPGQISVLRCTIGSSAATAAVAWRVGARDRGTAALSTVRR